MYWLERNLSQEQVASGSSVRDSKKEKAAETPPDILGAPNKKLGNIWSLSYVTSGGTSGGISGKSSGLRRVSFAPCNSEEAGPSSPTKESVDVVSSSSEDRDCEVSEVLRVPSSAVSEEQHESLTQAAQKADKQLLKMADICNGALVVPGSPALQPMDEEIPLPKTNLGQEVVKISMKISGKKKKTKKPKEKSSLYYLEPKLPHRGFPPPSPPPDVSHYTRSANSVHSDVSHYARSTNSVHSDLLDRRTQSDDDCLSYHIKKKLLALKLQEKARKKSWAHNQLTGVPSLNSGESDGSETGVGKGDLLPLFHSTPDSGHSLVEEAESNPTVYYTPKQSMLTCCSQEVGESEEMPIITSSLAPEDKDAVAVNEDPEKSPSLAGSATSGSTHNSLESSSSAPSFLIGSSTQLCQCIGTADEDSSEKFKQVLEKLTNIGRWGTASDQRKECALDQNEASEHENTDSTSKRLCLVDENWWDKFEKTYPEDSADEISANDDLLRDVDSSGEPSVSYHQIDLEDLLSQIYPDADVHENSTAGGGVVDAPCDISADSGENVVDGHKLESLVDFLCSTSGPGDVTSYSQKEMSLEIDDQCTRNDEMGGTQSSRSSQASSDLPPPQHVTIVMPEDNSFYSSAEEVATKPVTPAETSSFVDYLTGSNMQSFDLSKSPDKSSPAKDSPFCDDLIDISYEPQSEEQNITHCIIADGSETNHALLQGSDEWTDLSAEFLVSSLPNDTSLGEDSNISQEPSPETSLGSLDLSLDDILSSTQQTLTVNFKKDTKDASTLTEWNKTSPKDQKGANDAGKSTLVMDSLCSATDILEKSHDSLAKSVHNLCRRAIIKQSNISLELVLPTDKLQALDVEAEDDMKCFNTNETSPQKSSVLNVQLNSCIDYPQQVLQKIKRD